MVRSGGEGPAALAMTFDDSSIAEWSGNGFSHFLGHRMTIENLFNFHKSFPGGFVNSGVAQAVEYQPWGEGEKPYPVYKIHSACAALPDGRTMVILEKTQCIKEHALVSFSSIGWRIPNDVHNEYVRTFNWGSGSAVLEKSSGKGIIDTKSTRVSVDGKAAFIIGYGADSFKLNAPAESLSVIKGFPEMSSLYVNEICGHIENDEKHRYMPGDILADTAYAVVAGASLEDSLQYTLERIASSPQLRAVRISTPAGVWVFAAKFSEETALWQKVELPANSCVLIPYKS